MRTIIIPRTETVTAVETIKEVGFFESLQASVLNMGTKIDLELDRLAAARAKHARNAALARPMLDEEMEKEVEENVRDYWKREFDIDIKF